MIFITISLIIFPEQSFHASLRGLNTWWEVVFPSLLPFFIIAELLIRFGVAQFVGVLFEPVMRPLFNVPGVGSFAWIVGMASGYPTGAKITVLLRKKRQISRIEAERLVSFSNASSPLFIFGAIAVGFFHRPELGILIAISHYIGNLFVGICMRFYKKSSPTKNNKLQQDNKHILHKAFQKMHRTRLQKKQPIGQIIGDSVLSSVQTLLMIGGFIILFSVFTSILQITRITDIIGLIFLPLLQIFHMPITIIPALVMGLFEITMGAKSITTIHHVPLLMQLVLISFILGFHGFSIQAQVASILAESDIRFYPYFIGRILHALFASILCYFLIQFIFQDVVSLTFKESPQNAIPWEVPWKPFGPIITLITISLASFILLLRKK